MSKKIQPLLVIGTQRSGSNLLRLMLNQLPEIEAPHPPHLLQIFSPLLNAYGNLEEEYNFKKLVEDVVGYIKVNPVAWTNFKFDAEEIFNRCAKKNLVELFKVVYELKAEAKPAKFWCCKSMANLYYIPEIEKEFQPFYIYLLRDGRDVAASFKKAVVGEKHVYFIAQQWKKEQELSIAYTEKYAKERTAILRYEEFILNPKEALSPALKMLNLNWSDTILEYYKSEEAARTAASGEMWKNVIKPVDSSNMKHYSETLSPEEILIFEKVAGKVLVQLSYELENKNAEMKDDFTPEQINSFAAENVSLKKEMRLQKEKDIALRIPQEKIVSEIKVRAKK